MHNIISGIRRGRIEWIDALRTFAVLMVFFGHKTNNAYLEQVIYSFHIPIFFWISGFVFEQSKYTNFSSILVKKSQSLLKPYFIFALFSFIFWLVVVRSLSLRGQALSTDPWLSFWGIFYAVGIDPWRNPMDVALWFFPCLFITEILYWCINTYSRGFARTVTIILFEILGYCTTICMPLRLPWSADVALIAVIFFYLGNLTKGHVSKIVSIRFVWKILIIFVLAFIVALLSKANGKVDMNYNHYGNIIFFFTAAFSGIYLSFFIIQMLPRSNIVSYIGQNTIIIIGLAGVASFILNGFIYFLFHTLPSPTKLDLHMTIVYSFLEIGLLIPVVYIINRFAPFIIGRRRAE